MTINPNYDISIKANHDLFKYKNCEAQDILLKKFIELPQKLKWAQPKLSENGKYIGAHGYATEIAQDDYIMIWERSNPEKYLYQYHKNHIEGFEFAPNSKNLIIIYEEGKPINYNLSSGHPIIQFETKGLRIRNSITFAFSPHSRYFALATMTEFIIWDALTGVILTKLDDYSPSKYIRNDILVSISKTGIIKMIKFKENKVFTEFKLDRLTSHEQILNCMISPDMTMLYYVLVDGVYKVDISSVEVTLVQPFESNDSTCALISSDCTDFLTSNNELIQFWVEGKGLTGAMAKEKFNHMAVHFKLNLLVTIDDISINITDEANPETDEVFIWTNVNPTTFTQFVFTPDFMCLFIIVNEHHAVLYNTITGKVIKQWYNQLPNWSTSWSLVSKESVTALIATKSTESCIKLWNYNNGNEYMSLYGFNCNSTSFNPEGNLLSAGITNGEEIARVWTLDTGDHISFMNPGFNNMNTLTHITSESKYLIAQAKNQSPIVYEVETALMLFKCTGTILPRQINNIDSSSDLKYFYCQGISTIEDTPFAIIYSTESPSPIEEINRCTSIDISTDSRYLLAKIKKEENEGTIKQYDLQNNLKFIQYKDHSEYSQFLQDNKTIASTYGDENKTVFILYSTTKGESFGEINFAKKNKDFCQVEISAPDEKTGIIIRHISFEKATTNE